MTKHWNPFGDEESNTEVTQEDDPVKKTAIVEQPRNVVTLNEVNEVKASLEETTEKLSGVIALVGGCSVSNREAIRQISEHLDLPLAETSIDEVEELRQARPVFGDAAFAVLERALGELRDGRLDQEGVMAVLTFVAQKGEHGVVEALVAGATEEDED